MPLRSPMRSQGCRSVANQIVRALEQVATRVGKSLGVDAAKGVKRMYSGAGKGIGQVVKNTRKIDEEHAGKLGKVADEIDKAKVKTTPGKGAGGPGGKSSIADKLNPTGGKTGSKILDEIQKINGRNPINARYAGKTFDGKTWTPALKQKYPEGVKFKPNGFPDFEPYKKATVKLDGLTGNYATDESAALKKVGLSKTPDGMVWHHVEDGETMHLIPQDVHQAVRHTGGAAILKSKNK